MAYGLPEGFELDQDVTESPRMASVPEGFEIDRPSWALPEGFELDEPEEPGATFAGSAKALGRGAAEGLTTGLPEMAGEALEFVGGQLNRPVKALLGETAGEYSPFSLMEKGGKAVKEWSQEKAKDWFGEAPEDQPWLEKVIYEGSKMLAPSIIPGGIATTGARILKGMGGAVKSLRAAEAGLVSAKATGDLAKIAEAKKAIEGLKAGVTAVGKSASNWGAGSAGVLFGLSQAQSTIDTANQRADELERQGLYDEAKEARSAGQGIAPYLTGAIEAVTEFFGTKYLGKLLGVSDIEKRAPKELAKQFLRTLGVEVGTEMGQAAGETGIEKSFGVRPDANVLEETLGVIGPTAFMTLLTGGLASGANLARKKPYQPKVQDPKTILENIRRDLVRGQDDEGAPFTIEHLMEYRKDPVVSQMGLSDEINKIIIEHQGAKLDQPGSIQQDAERVAEEARIEDAKKAFMSFNRSGGETLEYDVGEWPDYDKLPYESMSIVLDRRRAAAQRQSEIEAGQAATRPPGEIPVRYKEPGDIETRIRAELYALRGEGKPVNLHSAAERVADDIMLKEQQEQRISETGRISRDLSSKWGMDKSRKERVKETEDREFEAWARKAADRRVSDEELLVIKKMMERAEEEGAFRQWQAKSGKSYADTGDIPPGAPPLVPEQPLPFNPDVQYDGPAFGGAQHNFTFISGPKVKDSFSTRSLDQAEIEAGIQKVMEGRNGKQGATGAISEKSIAEAARGGEVVSAVRAESAASRFRPSEPVVFEKSIVGPSGAKLRSYDWKWQPEEYVDKFGEERVRRVSNWDEAEASIETGRGIVHQFVVEMPDGNIRRVSAESVLNLLGFTDKETSKRFPSLANAVKTLAKLQMQLSVTEEKLVKQKQILDEVNKLPFPPIELKGLSESGGSRIWQMGDATVWDHKLEGPISGERKQTLESAWQGNRAREIGIDKFSTPYGAKRDFEERIEKQKKKIEQARKAMDEVKPKQEKPKKTSSETLFSIESLRETEQELKKRARSQRSKGAEHANSFRTWVALSGGVNPNDPDWKGEFNDIRWSMDSKGGRILAKGFPPGFWNPKARGLDELTDEAINAGWLPVGSTDEDFHAAIVSNPIEKAMDTGTGVDKWIEDQIDLELEKRHGSRDPEEFERQGIIDAEDKAEAEAGAAREVEAEEGLSAEEADSLASIAEEEAPWLFEKEEPTFKLTPSEATPQEQIQARRERGEITSPEKGEKPRAAFPDEKIKAPTTGKQKGMFGEETKKGETGDLFETSLEVSLSPREARSLGQVSDNIRRWLSYVLPKNVMQRTTLELKPLWELKDIDLSKAKRSLAGHGLIPVIKTKEGIQIEYVSKEQLGRAFGYFDGEKIQVREDLPEAIKRFVTQHEIYHSTDMKSKNWLTAEIKANFFPGIKDPMGLLRTVLASMTPERLGFYRDRIQNKGEADFPNKIVVGATDINNFIVRMKFSYHVSDRVLRRTVIHEGYHAWKGLLATEEDAQFMTDWYGNNEEKEANAFADWGEGKLDELPPTRIQKVWRLMTKALRWIRSRLGLQGMKTPEQVFEKIWGKEYETRMAESATMLSMTKKGEGRIPATPGKAESGAKITHFRHKDGKGLLDRSAWDLSKLTEDEELELPELLDYGLEQPRDVPQGSKFYFTEEGLQKHSDLIRTIRKASKTGLVKETATLDSRPVWESSDGQIAVSRKPAASPKAEGGAILTEVWVTARNDKAGNLEYVLSVPGKPKETFQSLEDLKKATPKGFDVPDNLVPSWAGEDTRKLTNKENLELKYKQEKAKEIQRYIEAAKKREDYKTITDDKFIKWFDEGEIVDKNGLPKILYHTTDADFKRFSLNEIRTIRQSADTIGAERTSQVGFWFSADPDISKRYQGDKTLKVYLNIKNAKAYTFLKDLADELENKTATRLRKELQSKGYDGIMVRYPYNELSNIEEYVAFHPDQIKIVSPNPTRPPESGGQTSLDIYDPNNASQQYQDALFNAPQPGKKSLEDRYYKATKKAEQDPTDLQAIKESFKVSSVKTFTERYLKPSGIDHEKFMRETGLIVTSRDFEDLNKYFRRIQTTTDIAEKFESARNLLNVQINRQGRTNTMALELRKMTESYFTLPTKQMDKVDLALAHGDRIGKYLKVDTLKNKFQLSPEEIKGYFSMRTTMDYILEFIMEQKMGDAFGHARFEASEKNPKPLFAADIIKAVKNRNNTLSRKHEGKTQAEVKEAANDTMKGKLIEMGLKVQELDFIMQEGGLADWVFARRAYMPHAWKTEWRAKVVLRDGREFMIEVPTLAGKIKLTREGRRKAAEKAALKEVAAKLGGENVSSVRLIHHTELPVDLYEGTALATAQGVIESATQNIMGEFESGLTENEKDKLKSIGENITKSLQELYLAKGWGRHLLARKGIQGYRIDFRNVVPEYLYGFSAYHNKMIAAREFAKHFKEINASNTPQLWAWAKEYVSDMLGDAQEAGAFKRVVGFYFLAGDISAAALNMTQNWTHAVGVIRGIQVKGGPTAEREIATAMKDVAGAWIEARAMKLPEKSKHLAPHEMEAIKEAFERGLLDPQFFGEVTGLHTNKWYMSGADKAQEWLYKGFIGAEAMNRMSTFIAAFRRAERAGEAKAVDVASKAVIDAHFLYGKGNRPELIRKMGAIGNIAYTFGTYPLNNIFFLKQRALNILKAATPQERRTAMKVLGSNLAYIFAFGGLNALPFMFLGKLVYKIFTDPDDDWEVLAHKYAPQWAARGVVRGIPAAFGNDMSWKVEGTDIGITPIGIQTAGTIARKVYYQGYKPIERGEAWHTLFMAMPDMLSNPYKAFFAEGAGTGIEGKPVIEYQGAEKALKATGFSPTRESEARKVQELAREKRDDRVERLGSFAERYVVALKEKDAAKRSDEIKEINRDVVEYNKEEIAKGKAGLPIGSKEIESMIKRRKEAREKGYEERMPKYMRPFQMEMGQTFGLTPNPKRVRLIDR